MRRRSTVESHPEDSLATQVDGGNVTSASPAAMSCPSHVSSTSIGYRSAVRPTLRPFASQRSSPHRNSVPVQVNSHGRFGGRNAHRAGATSGVGDTTTNSEVRLLGAGDGQHLHLRHGTGVETIGGPETPQRHVERREPHDRASLRRLEGRWNGHRAEDVGGLLTVECGRVRPVASRQCIDARRRPGAMRPPDSIRDRTGRAEAWPGSRSRPRSDPLGTSRWSGAPRPGATF